MLRPAAVLAITSLAIILLAPMGLGVKGLMALTVFGLCALVAGAVISRRALVIGFLSTALATLVYVPWVMQREGDSFLFDYRFLWAGPHRHAHPDTSRILVEWGLLAVTLSLMLVLRLYHRSSDH